jgi:hypothetical protein
MTRAQSTASPVANEQLCWLRYRVSHGTIVLPIFADRSILPLGRIKKAAKLFDIPPERQNRITVEKVSKGKE